MDGLERKKALQRSVELLRELRLFVESRNETYEKLNDHRWLTNFSLLTDIKIKMNKPNLERNEKKIKLITLFLCGGLENISRKLFATGCQDG